MPAALRLTTKTLNNTRETHPPSPVHQEQNPSLDSKPSAAAVNLKGGKEKLEELHEQVSQCAATVHDRKHALNAFKRCTYLTNIPLAAVGFPDLTAEKWALIEDDVCQNYMICLNGVDIGKGSTACRSQLEMQRVLSAVCNKVAAAATTAGNHNQGPGIYAAILLRLMQDDENSVLTTQLWQTVTCGGALELQPMNHSDNKKAMVDLYESGGCVHATFQTTHAYALFHPDQPDRPWIKFTAVVHERANLSTATSVRRLAIRWPRK